MAVLKFDVGERSYRYDGDRDWTAAELWRLDEIGVSHEDIAALLVDHGSLTGSRQLRAMCALVFIAAIREDPSITWEALSVTIIPATLGYAFEDSTPAPATVITEAQRQAAPVPTVPSDEVLAAQIERVLAARSAT